MANKVWAYQQCSHELLFYLRWFKCKFVYISFRIFSENNNSPPPKEKKNQKFIANFSINKKRNQILIFKFNRPFILISLINLTTKSTKLVLNEYREPILLDVSSSECAWSNFTAVNIWSNLGLCTCINYKQSWSLLQTNI